MRIGRAEQPHERDGERQRRRRRGHTSRRRAPCRQSAATHTMPAATSNLGERVDQERRRAVRARRARRPRAAVRCPRATNSGTPAAVQSATRRHAARLTRAPPRGRPESAGSRCTPASRERRRAASRACPRPPWRRRRRREGGRPRRARPAPRAPARARLSRYSGEASVKSTRHATATSANRSESQRDQATGRASSGAVAR